MKVLSVHLENFASYETLDFNFDNDGLTLISGPTGAGKSTLCDAIPWCLFGITAKGGKADEILSWHGGETTATAILELNDKIVTVTRSRKPNDLFFRTGDNSDANPTRGTDLNDTQKMINDLLGMASDLYLAGAYFHEFSQTAQFFSTTPKNRRSITENLVDLSLPVKLQNSIKTNTKDIEVELNNLNKKHVSLSASAISISELLENTKQLNDTWEHKTVNNISILQSKADSFEINKTNKIHGLEFNLASINTSGGLKLLEKMKYTPTTVTCDKCGVTNDNIEFIKLEAEYERNERDKADCVRLISEIETLKHSENIYQTQAVDLKSQANPYTDQVLNLDTSLQKSLSEIGVIEYRQSEFIDDKLNFEILNDTVSSFRSELVRNTIEDLEQLTSAHLREYFEGEITVNFVMTDADKLDIIIFKDGNECSFTQLSKGQRQMLKLSFGVAVIEVIQRHYSLDFSQLFFDESLDGLDDINKMKAVKLLEKLAVNRSVYIVEHSETVKALVDNKINVELNDGRSTIC